LDSPAVVVFGRLVILGGDQQRLHEEVISAGKPIREGRFKRFDKLIEMRQALNAVLPDPVSEMMKQQLVQHWDIYADPLMQSLEVGKSDRTLSLEKSLNDRCETEVVNITAILNELKQNIEVELIDLDPPPLQLSLFSETERDQFDRNRRSLANRLSQIPKEIE